MWAATWGKVVAALRGRGPVGEEVLVARIVQAVVRRSGRPTAGVTVIAGTFDAHRLRPRWCAVTVAVNERLARLADGDRLPVTLPLPVTLRVGAAAARPAVRPQARPPGDGDRTAVGPGATAGPAAAGVTVRVLPGAPGPGPQSRHLGPAAPIAFFTRDDLGVDDHARQRPLWAFLADDGGLWVAGEDLRRGNHFPGPREEGPLPVTGPVALWLGHHRFLVEAGGRGGRR